jgi:hypothetical protein
MSIFYLMKNASLELRTAAYFQAHGYLIRRGVMLSVAAGTAEATDIDLLAIRFGVPLTEERLIADCKDRRKPRPFERILWTLGLASFSHANRSVVVVPRAPWQAREFASQGGVEILGTSDVDTFLQATEAPYRPFGEADPEIAYRFDLCKKHIQDQGRELVREDLKLRQMLAVGHPLTNLNRVIRILSSIGKISMQTAGDTAWFARYVCFDAAVVASVMLVRFAAESKWTPEIDWADHARKRLTYGDVPPQKARQLARLALDRDFYDGLPTPQYTDEILQVIRSLISQPAVAAITPYALDFQLFGRILGSISNEYVVPVLGRLQEDTLKIGRRILSALAYASELPANVWALDKNSREIENASRQGLQGMLPLLDKKRTDGG